MSQNGRHQHSIQQTSITLPNADRPAVGFVTTNNIRVHDKPDVHYYRPQNEKMFVEGMRSVLRGVKRMKKETRDFCGLFGNLHYSDPENWRKILAPRDKLLDVKMLNALLSRPPKAQCYCACFCP